jgi:hypothetical protein
MAALLDPSLIERGRGPPRSGGRVRGYNLSGKGAAVVTVLPFKSWCFGEEDSGFSGQR